MKQVTQFLSATSASLALFVSGIALLAADPPAKQAPPATEKKPETPPPAKKEQKETPKPAAEAKPATNPPAEAKKTDAKPAEAPPANTEDGVPMKVTKKPADQKADDKKNATKETKTDAKAAPAAGGLLNMIRGAVAGPGGGMPAPKTPEEAVESGFKMLSMQNRGMFGMPQAPAAKPAGEKKEGNNPAPNPFDQEKKVWIEAIKVAVPLEKFKTLPPARQQEILQQIQNSMWTVRNQRNQTELSSQELRDASREATTLRLKRLAGLPAITPEPRAEIEKQLQSFVDLVTEKATGFVPDLMKNETVRKTFQNAALSYLKHQMDLTSSLSFKTPMSSADIDSAKAVFEQNLKQFETNKTIYLQNLYGNTGLGNFEKLTAEEKDKLVARQASLIGQNIFYNLYVFNRFFNDLQNTSARATTKLKGGSIDLTGGVTDKAMKDAERKLQRLQQREWRRVSPQQYSVDGKTPDEFAENIIKQGTAQWITRRGGIFPAGDKPQLSKEQQEQVDFASDRLRRILHEEISNEDFAKLDPTRRSGIANHGMQLVGRVSNYGRPNDAFKEQAEVAVKATQMEIRKEIRIPVIPVEQRDVTEKQIEQIINRMVELTAKKEPDVFLSEDVRDSYRDALSNYFDGYLSNTRDAAFKIPLSEEKFQQLLKQFDTKFRVYWTQNNRINIIPPNDRQRFTAMSKADKIAYLGDQNRSMNIGWSLAALANEIIQSVKMDYEMFARSTKFSKVDFSGGVSKNEELEVHNLQAKIYQKQQEKAAENAKKNDRSAADAGKTRQDAAALLMKPGLLTEEAQHRRFMFFVNSSIGAAIILLIMLLFKLRSNRLKKGTA